MRDLQRDAAVHAQEDATVDARVHVGEDLHTM